ncbi:glycosyltransferase family 2 protein [Roseomonas terrae]|jgi:glycosyltransferase involved in cell wall biosynthesis|uniref:Glycosyltransferase family 2 protein n=1 Tax=Neoroseomonas terrae TaxID=424799 RepID=A0ABS5EJ97_9PROT|nr:glycosyltransferase family A protein [Neoroseomonas terrae]MBR0651035.1 glycosyltransferase family 2 protein [Neoroseomonas terrae]
MAEPSISVVIPAYRATATIDAAIDSARAQTVSPAEIIVVDDGCPDGVGDHVARRHGDVRVIWQANAGCGMARNTGAAAARGHWLAFLDADDAWLPGKLERQVREIGPKDVAVVACRDVGQTTPPFVARPDFDAFWEGNQIVVSSTLVRRAAFEQAGAFWSRRACEDYHLWLRLTGTGWTVVNCPEELVVYAPSAMSLSRQIESFAAAELACLADVAERFHLPPARLQRRVAECCLRHSRGAVHHRQMRAARHLALSSFRAGVSLPQVTALLAAFTPVAVLEARRRMMGGGAT